MFETYQASDNKGSKIDEGNSTDGPFKPDYSEVSSNS